MSQTVVKKATFSTYTTPSGFQLPSVHSAPPFFTQQPNPTTQATVSEQWSRLILTYARFKKLFMIRVEDAEGGGGGGDGKDDGDWAEVLRNERINRKMKPAHLSTILEYMVGRGQAVYEPAKQSRSVMLYWRTPEEWAEVLHGWASSTGQLNTILTFLDIAEPPVPSPLEGIPVELLRRAIAVLVKTGPRAQLINIADGDGVRFFAPTSGGK